MSYTVAIIIYGVTPSDALTFAIDKHYRLKSVQRKPRQGIDVENDWNWTKLEAAGFGLAYEGHPEFWFGIVLHDPVDHEIGETEAVELSKLPPVTDKARVAFAKNLARLPEDVRKHVGEPKWLMVWGRT